MHLTFLISFIILCYASQTFGQDDLSQYVNPFLGSVGPTAGQAYGGGDIFVGAALPFGVVKFGIDTHDSPANESANNGGYTPNGNVTGISLLHESGTGGGPKYGFPAQMPLTSVAAPVNILDNQTYWQPRVGNDSALIGYYRTSLQNGVTAELSATRHAGIAEYSFPPGEQHILVDLSHTQTFSGRNTFPVGRYFRTFDGHPVPNPTFGGSSASSGPLGDCIGALFSWNATTATTIRSRIGVSFISTEKACHFKEDEIPNWNLNVTAQAARDEWNRDVFSKIQTSTDASANRTLLTMLYSALYFSHLIPSERSGENPLWTSDEPYWDDFYTMWDLFRNTASLWHLIQPSYYEGMIRAVIDIWRHEGYMPDGRSGNYNGLVQGGSNADNVLADAYVKGLRGAINWTDGYQALVTDAEITPLNDNNPVDPTGSLKEGRSALDDWKNLGYVSADNNNRAVSKSQEYSVNDFAVAQIAKGEAPADVAKYLNRSAGWQRSWDHDVESRGFRGFLTPRLANGSFNESYELTQCGDCNWADVSYEATPFEYSFIVPHDMETLIDFMGGPDEFERRLDYMFQPNTTTASLGPNGATTTLMNIGDEPDFLTPYLYHFIQKSHKSVSRVHQLFQDNFNAGLQGVPGNSDAGALNTWGLWAMLGLYPLATTPVYLLGSPLLSDVNVTLETGTLRIRAYGIEEGMFVQRVKVNGTDWRKNYVEHGDVMNGGEIEFYLGSEEKVWEDEGPPSLGHVEL
ncbi:MAG: hypothetical protein Q9162_007015 [Coniocarpon cinnabarinum]